MLIVQRAFLGNICQLLLILILTLGLSCWPQMRSEDGADDGSFIPVLHPLSPPGPGGLSKPGHSLLVVPQVNPHPLIMPSLLERGTLPVSFPSNFGISYFVQPKRKEPPWPLSTDLSSTRTSPRLWGEGTPMWCSAAKQSWFLSVPLCFFGFLAVPAHWADDFRELSVIHFLVATVSKFSITYTQVGLFFLGWISLTFTEVHLPPFCVLWGPPGVPHQHSGIWLLKLLSPEFLVLLAVNMPRTKGMDARFRPPSVSSSHLFHGFFDALSKDGSNFDGVRNCQTLAMWVYLVSHVSLFFPYVKWSTSWTPCVHSTVWLQQPSYARHVNAQRAKEGIKSVPVSQENGKKSA